MKRYIIIYLLILGNLLAFNSCRKDELDPNSIFIDPPYEGADPNSYSYELDRWLYDNFLKPYNIQFRYRLEDVGSYMNYNLVPTTYEKSKDMAVLVKYLWLDSYVQLMGEDFVKTNVPRIFHLVGSPEYNPANGTEVLGVAEGGLKITLTKCNELDLDNLKFANEQYFKTIFHEYQHILHQKKPYPREYNLFSAALYEPFSWQDRPDKVARSMGLVSSYAGSSVDEDFVEVIANYIVRSDADWQLILNQADQDWRISVSSTGMTQYEKDPITGETVTACVIDTVSDGIPGKDVILQKLNICKNYLRDSWNIDLDSLHAKVQSRQFNISINMDSLRRQLTDDYLH